jgi:lipopolysaccharide transport system permease protein
MVFLLVIHTAWTPYLLWVPLLILAMVVLATGIGMIVSAASLFFRDVKYIVEVLVTFGIFFSPVFYDIRTFGARGKWLLLNPVAPILDGLSSCIARRESPELFSLGYSFAFGLLALFCGYMFFKHLEGAFAESI